MTTLIPNSQASGVETYEEMFKEITKKLYGEEATQSLQTPMTHVTPDVERSFNNLLSDRNDYDHAGIDNVGAIKTDDHLTAFGLAALMQNGFASPNALLNSHTLQQMNKQNQSNSTTSTDLNTNSNINTAPPHNNGTETTQEKCASLQHGNKLSTWNLNSKSEVYQHTSKHYKSKKHEVSHQQAANGTANNVNQTQNNGQSGHQKRYNCSSCPYSTDRRDLFTRHENIHKEDKPFHCYVCLKQFNRADHVKKHFLRMHRGLNYDIGRTKRILPQTKSKKTNSSGIHTNNDHLTPNLNVPVTYHSSLNQNQHHQQMETISQPSIIDQTNQHLNTTFHTTTTTSNHSNQTQSTVKFEKKVEKSTKKNDKRFMCCYCSWSGNDNWGLKRHLNTHTKPFVCALCDYKAARSERLATHVFKVHNKKVCTKCNYLAENQSEYDAHVNDTHANETRAQRSSQAELKSPANNALKNKNNCFSSNNSFNDLQTANSASGFGWRSMMNGGASSPNVTKSNGNSSQKRGAERLFQYFEADESDPEDFARQLQMAAISRNTASVAQDFHNAGGGKMMGAKVLRNFNRNFRLNTIIETKSSAEWNTDDEENFIVESLIEQSISPPANQMTHFKEIKATSDCYKNEMKKKLRKKYDQDLSSGQMIKFNWKHEFEQNMHFILKDLNPMHLNTKNSKLLKFH